MANYCAQSRTNYFKVKDEAAFEAWCKRWDGDLDLVRGGDDKDLYAILVDGSAPSARYEPEDSEGFEDLVEADFLDELAEHLEEEWVAILMESGHERRRYVSGYAVAINSNGDYQTVNLDLIYDAAKELGEHITRAEL